MKNYNTIIKFKLKIFFRKIFTCGEYSNFGIIFQSVIEFAGRFNCSCDGSTSGNSSSGSVLSVPLAVVTDKFATGCC
jgi:hypothetical protein